MKLRAKALAAWVLVLSATSATSAATSACSDKDVRLFPEENAAAVAAVRARPPGRVVPSRGTGLRYRLSEGSGAAAADRVPQVAATPLDAAQTAAIVARLPPLVAVAGDEQDFALRPASQPPPRAGNVVKTPFPPPGGDPPAPDPDAVASKDGALVELRHAPEGDVPIAPHLSVTFSQPMVAVASHADAAFAKLPVTLSPQPPGKWRWVGTRTALFEPEGGRFPMATEYRVDLAADLTSVNGARLEPTAKGWSFRTPPPTVKQYWPTGNDPVRRDPLLFVEVDQKISPEAVLATITLDADSKRALRLATPAEIEADPDVRALGEAAEPGTWLAFKPIELLPVDYRIDLELGPGTPSLEGPRRSAEPFAWSFRTFGPMQMIERRCAWSGPCRPDMRWTVRFSNPVDEEAFDPSFVKVEPALPGLSVTVNGDGMVITGRVKGRTSYTVTLASKIQDVFGQNLAEATRFTFDVGDAHPRLSGPNKPVVVLDPAAKPMFSVYSTNFKQLRVTAHVVTPADWNAYATYLDEYHRRDREPVFPGRRVFSEVVDVQGSPDELTETRIDLSRALDGGFGHVLVKVEDTRTGIERWEHQRVDAWVQSTRLGLTAIADGDQLHAWATELASGAPASGVELGFWPEAGAHATSSADGLARLELPAQRSARDRLLVARRGKDVAFVAEGAATIFVGGGGLGVGRGDFDDEDYGGSYYGRGDSWVKRARVDQLRWHVLDDRSMYRPGEEVHVKGWMRRLSAQRSSDLALPGVTRVAWRVLDRRRVEIGKGEAAVSGLGGFDFAFKLPGTPNLGQATLELTAVGAGGVLNASRRHGFQIQEFRRPEFEVDATVGEGPFVIGDFAEVAVAATYYAGGGLAGADVEWTVSTTPGSFSPPGRSDYSFGVWTPWWGSSSPRTRRPAPRASGKRGGPQRASSVAPEGPLPTSFGARTSPLGGHVLRIDFDSTDEPRATQVTAQAAVTDVNRQEWAASAGMLVHPASVYVGLRAPRVFVEAGKPIEVDALVVDLDGKPVGGVKIALRAVRVEHTWKRGQYEEVEKDAQDCPLVSGATDAPGRCSFTAAQGGTWRITASVKDAKGRANRTELTRWVAGGKRPPARGLEREEVSFVPDKREYRPGETAELLLQAPFHPANGLVTILRDGVASTERLVLDGPTHTLRVPITEQDHFGLSVRVDLTGEAPRLGENGALDPKLAKRPAYATGQIALAVPPLPRRLTVAVAPRASELEPGAETDVDVVVTDAAGRPAGDAEVALVVVDESILALTGRSLGDPLTGFYGGRSSPVTDAHSRAYLLLASVVDVTPATSPTDPSSADDEAEGFGRGIQGVGPGGSGSGIGTIGTGRYGTLGHGSGVGSGYGVSGGKGGMRDRAAAPPSPKVARPSKEEESSDVKSKKESGSMGAAPEPGAPIRTRSDFNPLAAWAPAARTDAQGRAVLHVKVPDNLTRYRVMAIAVHGEREMGAGESTITARLPLMVRPAAPRFLNFGDRFELGVVLHNQTEVPMLVELAVRGTNVDLGDGLGRRVLVPPDDRVEVRLPAAAKRAGTARVQIAAVGGGKWTDASELSLPVWTPATTEAFATYGELDGAATLQPIAPPAGAFTEFGGLDVATSSTALAQLTDAVLYLVNYRFECSEQISSRMLAVAALKDVLAAFRAEGLPPAAQVNASFARDVDRLKGRQDSDGGFLMWDDSDGAWPWGTLHVTHALARGKQKGFAIPAGMLENALEYARVIDRHLPGWWSPRTRWSHRAYALYVRKIAGAGDVGMARELLAEATPAGLGMDDLGFLLVALAGDPAGAEDARKILRYLQNRVSETAAGAHFVTDYDKEQGYLVLASSRRADGVLLEALIAADPKSDLIPKLVRGLMNDRKKGHWGNTQENTFVLLGLDRYFKVYEKVTPSFVARVWLGPQFAGEHAFRGRTTETHELHVPMAMIAEPADLVIGKDGPGRLYYRIGMRYAPKNLEIAPAEHGFTVERTYEGVDDPKDVTRDAKGVWHFKAGARVRVRLTMAAVSPRAFVALVDPIPAGIEPMNGALMVTAAIPDDPKAAAASAGPYWYWAYPWYEHQNMRDERVEAFATRLWGGVYTYSYVARATTFGTFVVPPAKAEEMYSPETFGRSASDKVVVE